MQWLTIGFGFLGLILAFTYFALMFQMRDSLKAIAAAMERISKRNDPTVLISTAQADLGAGDKVADLSDRKLTVLDFTKEGLLIENELGKHETIAPSVWLQDETKWTFPVRKL